MKWHKCEETTQNSNVDCVIGLMVLLALSITMNRKALKEPMHI